MKDKKGNNIQLKTPASYSSEVLGLVVTLERGKDGHLVPKFEPSKIGGLHGTVASYGRNRLAIVPANALKVATNENYAGKPLYDSTAKLGTKAEQAATTITTGLLPIGLQGVTQTNAVKKHLPGNVQDIINANTPGTNPLAKSFGSSFGLTPQTDKTVGKGLDTNRYFSAKDQVASQLKTQQAKDAFDLYTGSKKNPVTGKYDVQPTVWDGITKASALNSNPDALNALITMNKKLASQGAKTDPLWSATPEQIKAYFQYQANPDPFSPQKSVWYDNNKSWYQPLSDTRSKFFNSLPPGDPNKPSQPVEFPNPTPAVQGLKDQYYKITDPTQAFKFSQANPDLQAQFDKEFKYKNDILSARGMSKYKDYPTATPQMQKYIDTYTNADKSSKKGLRNSNPQAYQGMIAYFDSVDLYNINKEGSKNQLQGQPDQTSKQNKAISGLAKDIYKNPDGTYSITPAGWMNGMSNGSGGSGGSGGGYGGYGSKSKTGPSGSPYSTLIKNMDSLNKKVASSKVKGTKLVSKVAKPSTTKQKVKKQIA